jgi:paraquat-inducible protein B
MTVIHENLSFTILVMAAMSLLTFSITTQNTSATTSETRMLADLNPTDGAIADGRADYRERGNSVRLNVEVEDVSPNTTFTVEISGNTLGTITTSSFGTAELELNTNDGQVVPKILRGDLVQIFQGTELVLSGAFDGVDGNIENGGQAPITPNQNSVMQAGNSSTNLFTVPSSNTTLQDAPVTVTNSSSNNATIQNLQQQIVALQQTVDALQQALMALQSGPQEGNVTISSGNNNNTAASPIQ